MDVMKTVKLRDLHKRRNPAFIGYSRGCNKSDKFELTVKIIQASHYLGDSEYYQTKGLIFKIDKENEASFIGNTSPAKQLSYISKVIEEDQSLSRSLFFIPIDKEFEGKDELFKLAVALMWGLKTWKTDLVVDQKSIESSIQLIAKNGPLFVSVEDETDDNFNFYFKIHLNLEKGINLAITTAVMREKTVDLSSMIEIKV